MIALCDMVHGRVRVRLIGAPVIKDMPVRAVTCTKNNQAMRLVRSGDPCAKPSSSWKTYRKRQWR